MLIITLVAGLAILALNGIGRYVAAQIGPAMVRLSTIIWINDYTIIG